MLPLIGMKCIGATRRHAAALVPMAAIFLAWPALAQRYEPPPSGPIILLWPDGAPGAVGATEADKPHLEVFSAGLDARSEGPRMAVIVAPGGSYTSLSNEAEGIRVAEWLNLQGVTAFVLTYRLSPRYHYPAPILDGERAVRLVRFHAAEYGVAPDRVGMWGFSAGGHLTGVVATLFDHGNRFARDPVDRVSDRPDFAISSYGRLSLDPSFTPSTALRGLLGDNPAPGVRDLMSPDKHVTAQTPPFFLFATTADRTVPSLCSVLFYAALKRKGVTAELHVFEEGQHGASLGGSYPELTDWTALLSNWMRMHGWIASPK